MSDIIILSLSDILSPECSKWLRVTPMALLVTVFDRPAWTKYQIGLFRASAGIFPFDK
jgi:hypothetical protein